MVLALTLGHFQISIPVPLKISTRSVVLVKAVIPVVVEVAFQTLVVISVPVPVAFPDPELVLLLILAMCLPSTHIPVLIPNLALPRLRLLVLSPAPFPTLAWAFVRVPLLVS